MTLNYIIVSNRDARKTGKLFCVIFCGRFLSGLVIEGWTSKGPLVGGSKRKPRLKRVKRFLESYAQDLIESLRVFKNLRKNLCTLAGPLAEISARRTGILASGPARLPI